MKFAVLIAFGVGAIGAPDASAATSARRVSFDDLFRIEWGATVERVQKRAPTIREDGSHIAPSARAMLRAFVEPLVVGDKEATATYTFRDRRLIDVTVRFASTKGLKALPGEIRERLGKETSKSKGRHRWTFGPTEVSFRDRNLAFSTQEEFGPIGALSQRAGSATAAPRPVARAASPPSPKKPEPLDLRLAEFLRLKPGRMVEIHKVDLVDDSTPETVIVGPVFSDSLETRGVAIIAEKKGDLRLLYRGRICPGALATLYLQSGDLRFEGMKELLIASRGDGGKVVQTVLTLDAKARTARYFGGRLAGEQVFGCYVVNAQNHRDALHGIDFKDIDHDDIPEVRVAYEAGVPSRPDPKVDIYYWQRGGLYYRETVRGRLSDAPDLVAFGAGAGSALVSTDGVVGGGAQSLALAPPSVGGSARPEEDEVEGAANPTREFEVVDELVRNGVVNAHDITTAVLRLRFPHPGIEEIQLWPPHGDMPNFGRKWYRWRSKSNAALVDEYLRVFREIVQPLVLEKMKSEIGRYPSYGRDFRGNLKISPDGYQTRGLSGTHHGVDYLDHLGTPVQSLYDGVVTKKAYNGGFGNYVVVRTDGPDNTHKLLYYAHQLDDPPVEVGDRVRAGQVIGFVGSSGRSAGPHVHLEHHEFKNGKRVRLRHGIDEFKKVLKAAGIKF